MDLINDLENEMAFAFFVEKKYGQTIDSEDSLALIRHIRSSLVKVTTTRTDPDPTSEFKPAAGAMHG